MKSKTFLLYTHIYTHTANICLECGGGQLYIEDGKWREGRQGREVGGHKGVKDQWKEYEWKGKEEEVQCDGHRDYKPGDDGLKTEDLE